MAWNDDLWSALFSVALIGHVLAFVVFGVLLPALQQQQQQQRQDSISHPADDVTANAAGTAPAPAAAEYEFTDAQERVLRGVKLMMQKSGQLFGVLCALTCCDALVGAASPRTGMGQERSLVDLAAQLSDGLDWGFFSYFLFQAKNSFKAVYRTRGHDIQHLMSGMTQLFLLFKRMSFILTVIIGKNCLVALVRIPFVQALINDASASGARDNDASASNSNAPMPRRQAVALLCAEAIVLTALGMYGVRKDEEAQGRAAQSDVVGDAGEQNGESNNEKTEIDAGAGGEQKKSN